MRVVPCQYIMHGTPLGPSSHTERGRVEERKIPQGSGVHNRCQGIRCRQISGNLCENEDPGCDEFRRLLHSTSAIAADGATSRRCVGANIEGDPLPAQVVKQRCRAPGRIGQPVQRRMPRPLLTTTPLLLEWRSMSWLHDLRPTRLHLSWIYASIGTTIHRCRPLRGLKAVLRR